MKKIFLLVIVLWFQKVSGQTYWCDPPDAALLNCVQLSSDGGTSEFIVTPEPTNPIHFGFETFKDYTGGIVYYGVSRLKLKVDEQIPGDCKWQLYMILGDEWQEELTYGPLPGTPPPTSLIKFRINNQCNTPINNGVWQNFPTPYAGEPIPIISAAALRTLPVVCDGSEVNGPGNYLQYNGSMTFTIDIRVGPFFNAGAMDNFTAGVYSLNLKFCLREAN